MRHERRLAYLSDVCTKSDADTYAKSVYPTDSDRRQLVGIWMCQRCDSIRWDVVLIDCVFRIYVHIARIV